MEHNNQFFTTELATAYWLHSMGVEKYTINEDLTVDVDGDVNLTNKNLNYISVQFGIVKGYFDCSKNHLTTLKGCPIKIGNNFRCYKNKLVDLKYMPKNIGGNLYCHQNPITDFNYLNFEVAGDIFFTSTKNMNYLDKYKDQDGDVDINFNDFKRLQALKQLNDKLNNDLSINTNFTKKLKI